jgi:hypothetical protein
MFSSSNSEIISQIISVNKDEFTNNVQEIINQEMVKLSNKINLSVEETIKKKISEFYNLNFDYEDILFDKEIDYKTLQPELHNGAYTPPDFNAIKKHFFRYDKDIKNDKDDTNKNDKDDTNYTNDTNNKIKFFEINFNTNQTNNQATIKYMFSKTLIIQTRINRSSYNQNWKHSTIKEVNIPNNILMVIKTLFSNGGSSQYESENSAPQLFNFIDKYIKEPQLFMEKCPEFETICSREYKKIEEMKEAHRLNIEEFRQHYSDFKQLQADIKKIKEEKEKLALVKLALNNLAVEINTDAKKNKDEREAIARERAELDSMKSIKIDLDSYFEN